MLAWCFLKTSLTEITAIVIVTLFSTYHWRVVTDNLVTWKIHVVAHGQTRVPTQFRINRIKVTVIMAEESTIRRRGNGKCSHMCDGLYHLRTETAVTVSLSLLFKLLFFFVVFNSHPNLFIVQWGPRKVITLLKVRQKVMLSSGKGLIYYCIPARPYCFLPWMGPCGMKECS